MSPENTQTDGGINALRGFRKQFLHSLYRIINSENELFYPEGIEDLDVYDANNRLIEIVQVKDYSSPLQFSNLDKLFERALKVIKEFQNVRVTIASYGEIGPELHSAINLNEIELKSNKKFNKPNVLPVMLNLNAKLLNEDTEFNELNNHRLKDGGLKRRTESPDTGRKTRFTVQS